MNTIPTAEELGNKLYKPAGESCKEFAIRLATEFAKLHVQAALEAAAKKASIIDDPYSYTGNTGSEYPPDRIIDRYSILNAYPEELIK